MAILPGDSERGEAGGRRRDHSPRSREPRPQHAAYPEGPEGIKQLVGAYREAFPDLRFEILDMFSSEDRVAHRWTFTGTHEGEMFGVPPTGERVEVSGVEMHRVRDGQVVETWVGYDALGLMRQFGLESRRAG